MSEKEINFESAKQEFKSLLLSTNRKGIENLINWLETHTDFFAAPSSTMYHENRAHGLLYHSLNVYHAAKQIMDNLMPLKKKNNTQCNFTDTELKIACLLHDLCKVNSYKEVEKFWKDDSAPKGLQWKKYVGYEKSEDQLPLGHGSKSMFMAQNFIQLTANEAAGILWHMNFFDPSSTMSSLDKASLSSAIDKYDIVTVVALADIFSANIIEEIYDLKTLNDIVIN